METISIRFPEDLLATLEDEAEEMGFSSRAEYIRYLLHHRAAPRQPVTRVPDDATSVSELQDDLTVVTERIDTLTERVSEIETQLEAQSQVADPVDDALVDAVSSHLEQTGVGTEKIREISIDAIQLLIEDGELSAGELRDRLYTRHTDAYSSPESLWNSAILRQFEAIPGLSRTDDGTYVFDTERAQAELESD